MATTKLKGNDVNTSGDLPLVGQEAPAFTVTGADGAEVSLDQYAGRKVVLNIFPNIETSVCAMSVRRFNELASRLENTTVLCLSNDQPETLSNFCAAEGLSNVVVGSGVGQGFGDSYGLTIVDGPLAGRLARSVVVVNEHGEVVLTELVPEITQEPDYDAALEVLKN
ncbi:thiol peroxidase [Aestuariimicrobium soli]|uniref:thiol peroxidase n=1 Tax=Aestuariimicrobium soli TaxID=2035834 RepID=UPI003EB7967E